MPLETLEVDRHTRRELHAHDVDEPVRRWLCARHDGLHVGMRVDDPFGEQEADGQVLVAAGRAHRDRDFLLGAATVRARVADPDAERLLGRDDVGFIGSAVGADAPHVETAHGLLAAAFVYL